MGWAWNPGREDQCLKIDHLKTSFSLFSIKVPENPEDGKNYPSLFGSEIAHMVRAMSKTRPFVRFNHGFCHPSTCSAQDLINIFDHYFDHSLDIYVKNGNRVLKPPPSVTQQFAVFILSMIIIINITSTLKCNGIPSLPLGHRSFDVIYNTESVFQNTKSSDGDDLNDTRMLNGIKSVYLMISIMVHSAVTMSGVLGPMYNTVYNYSKYSPNLIYTIVRTAVDGIVWNMLLTATVSVLSWSPFLQSTKGRLDFKSFILVRFLRLLPIVLTMVLITIAAPMMNITNGGLLFNPVVQRMSENCHLNGWREITFIGNWVPAADTCLTVGWFLSADFQLNVICFPLLLSLFNNLRKGINQALVYIIFGIFVELYVLYAKYDAYGYVSASFENFNSFESVHIHHFWTTNYIPSYVIGLVVGSLVYRKIRILDSLHSNWKTVIVLTCTTLLATQTYMTRDINYWSFSHWKIFTAAMTRTTSGILLAPVLYFGWMSMPSNIFRWMFTSPIHDFISKALLPSYLSHCALIVWFTTYSRSEALDIDNHLLIHLLGKGLVVFPLSILCGLVLHVLVEIPFMKLLKSLLMRK